jgi:hypothetical protein
MMLAGFFLGFALGALSVSGFFLWLVKGME